MTKKGAIESERFDSQAVGTIDWPISPREAVSAGESYL
jgi:hypothetical protein